MMPQKLHFPMLIYAKGGWYQRGKVLTLPKSLEIGYECLNLGIILGPERPSQRQLATGKKGQDQSNRCQ
jgi:hypothetical protein